MLETKQIDIDDDTNEVVEKYDVVEYEPRSFEQFLRGLVTNDNVLDIDDEDEDGDERWTCSQSVSTSVTHKPKVCRVTTSKQNHQGGAHQQQAVLM
jgi:hypothetical protein